MRITHTVDLRAESMVVSHLCLSMEERHIFVCMASADPQASVNFPTKTPTRRTTRRVSASPPIKPISASSSAGKEVEDGFWSLSESVSASSACGELWVIAMAPERGQPQKTSPEKPSKVQI